MTPERMRIKIAEALGWKRVEYHPALGNQGWTSPDRPGTRLAPDFCNDLNSCHDMEKILTKSDHANYVEHLITITNINTETTGVRYWTNYFLVSHATALQRCEAFLRTKGLWEEEEV